jgi:5-methyltetrahydrofolate--homocysteine methyltransferase
LADYLATVESGVMDVLPMQIVTVGHCATEYTNTLFANDDYSDYFYFHGFAVEMAEALAEYWHAQVRQELAITGKEAGKVGLQLLKQLKAIHVGHGNIEQNPIDRPLLGQP